MENEVSQDLEEKVKEKGEGVVSDEAESQGEAALEESAEELELAALQRRELLAKFSEVERQALVEAVLFVSGEMLSKNRIADVIGLEPSVVQDILDSIKMKLSLEESGVELFSVGGNYQLRSKPEFAPFVQQLRATRPKKLSQQALETLAIVAYRQPIVKSDVEKIRGVDATPTLKTLIDRGFIRIVGHQESVGQPALYGTTDQFLKVFGLSSLSELPTLRDLKQLEAHKDVEEEIFEEQQSVQESDERVSSQEMTVN